MRERDIRGAFRETVAAYREMGFDLSRMRLKTDPQPVYADGKPSFEFCPEESAGNWTGLGYVRINPDLSSVMDRYGLKRGGREDEAEFAKAVIAHELAHEIYSNAGLASESDKMSVIAKAVLGGFTTPYLKTVKANKIAEEMFCEYMASEVVGRSRASVKRELCARLMPTAVKTAS